MKICVHFYLFELWTKFVNVETRSLIVVLPLRFVYNSQFPLKLWNQRSVRPRVQLYQILFTPWLLLSAMWRRTLWRLCTHWPSYITQQKLIARVFSSHRKTLNFPLRCYGYTSLFLLLLVHDINYQLFLIWLRIPIITLVKLYDKIRSGDKHSVMWTSSKIYQNLILLIVQKNKNRRLHGLCL